MEGLVAPGSAMEVVVRVAVEVGSAMEGLVAPGSVREADAALTWCGLLARCGGGLSAIQPAAIRGRALI